MYLRFDLGPIHLLDGLIDEIMHSDSSKSYIRKENKLSRVVSKNVNKSAAIHIFEKKSEEKLCFLISFWFENPKKSK